MSTTADIRKKKALGWPQSPYKGLSYYGPDDAPLFAGRDGDVRQCAELLMREAARVLILHGSTGCGKSSFLRAGLIPYMEDLPVSYHFIKAGGSLSALFVRSTDKPLIELAKAVYNFAKQDLSIDTPLDDYVSFNLRKVVEGYTESQFVEQTGADGDFLTGVLKSLAERLNGALVLIVDQGEEVLTLRPDAEGDPFRKSFFKFIARLSATETDIKLLVALRTDYYGRFVGHMQRSRLKQTAVTHYLLDDLTPEQIVSAITRPTSRRPVGDYGAPYDFYGFEYEEGLPQKIADDLVSKKLAGGILPVMQIVCDRLYQKTRPPDGAKWTIKKSDYRALGSIEDQLDEHFNLTFEQLCKQNNIADKRAQEAETYRWKGVLSILAKAQPDGTITTDVKAASELREAAHKADCRLDFDKTMSYLTDDKVRILRSVELIEAKTNKLIECYSLGHDAIGLVLEQWKVTKEGAEATVSSIRRRSVAGGIIALLLGTIFLGVKWALPSLPYIFYIEGLVFALYGVLLILGATLFRSKFHNRPFFSPFAIETFYFRVFAVYAPFLPSRMKESLVKNRLFLAFLREHPQYLERFEKYLP